MAAEPSSLGPSSPERRTPERHLARAKVNLSLRVVGRLPPGDPKAGYHLLDSLVVFAEAGDRLSVEPGTGLSLRLSGPFAAGLEGEADNLVLRAARALAAAVGRTPDLALHLEKHLPISSGIGGGSADAAATLQAISALWELPAGQVDLAGLGLGLGADLPVCLAGRPTMVQGIGETLLPVPSLPPAWILLANPGQGLATPAVFAAREGAFSEPFALPAAGFPSAAELARYVTEAGNDLTQAASRLCPAIPALLEALAGLEGALVAALSGSGATCFALFAEAEAAEAAAERARRDGLAPWLLPAPLARG